MNDSKYFEDCPIVPKLPRVLRYDFEKLWVSGGLFKKHALAVADRLAESRRQAQINRALRTLSVQTEKEREKLNSILDIFGALL